MSPSEVVRHYHERSKHSPQRYAPGPGGLDWDSQPDPFRRFDGARQIELPLLADELPVSWDQLFVPSAWSPQPLDLDPLALLFELSLGLSAWKHYGGSRWALRCNPSSGNLHPTEAYLICPTLPGIDGGVFHYRPDQHALEQRAAAPFAWTGGVFVALSGIHWREAWKYGLRAFRYCQHDAGHAQGALAYAAALLGWPARRIDTWSDAQLMALCGLDRSADFPPGDGEDPEALLWIGPGTPPDAPSVLATLRQATWSGRANALSPTHRDWPDIPTVADATRRPGEGLDPPIGGPAAAGSGEASAGLSDVPGASSGEREVPEPLAGALNAPALPTVPAVPFASTAPNTPTLSTLAVLPPLSPACATPASLLIRRRRSAQVFDGVTLMSQRHFFRLLDALLPRRDVPPWSLLDAPPAVHPVLFVHRVEDIAPGIYALPRSPAAFDELRAALRPEWLWERVGAAPPHLPLYLLAPLDVQSFAAGASCQQDIAADSAFMLAMLARFDDLAAQPWRYRERFAEAGLLGQVLYMEAEAGDLQGTGIGCYFDDLVHGALGVDTTRFQDLYHFTVGRALIDQRLGSEAGYDGLVRARSA